MFSLFRFFDWFRNFGEEFVKLIHLLFIIIKRKWKTRYLLLNLSKLLKKPVSEAKRKQLEGAREKRAVQKKVIEPDSDSSEDEPEPAKKRSKVITKGSNSGSDMEQWGTTAIRTAALVSLAAATFYMQNIYGKKNIQTPAPATQAPIPMQANMLPTVNRSYVGKSGFAI